MKTTYNRWTHRFDQISETTSHANDRYMNTPEKKAKLSNMKKRAQSAEPEVQMLKRRVEQLTQKHGESVDSSLHRDLVSIMQEKTEIMKQAYPEGSFSWLFWENQLHTACAKDPCQVRWHSLII